MQERKITGAVRDNHILAVRNGSDKATTASSCGQKTHNIVPRAISHRPVPVKRKVSDGGHYPRYQPAPVCA